jgi:hypothetical protein
LLIVSGTQDLGHLDCEGLELPGVRRRLGKPDVLVRARGLGVYRHTDLMVANVVHPVEHLDLPLGGAFDLLAEVECRLRGIDTDGRLE